MGAEQGTATALRGISAVSAFAGGVVLIGDRFSIRAESYIEANHVAQRIPGIPTANIQVA